MVTHFKLAVDAHRASGPDNGGYGLVFRRQPLGAGDVTTARYVLYVTVDGRYSLHLVHRDGTIETLQPLRPSNFIKTDNAKNRLAINVQGGSVTVVVNNASIASYPLAITTPGGISLVATTPDHGPIDVVGIDAAFSNLAVPTNPSRPFGSADVARNPYATVARPRARAASRSAILIVTACRWSVNRASAGNKSPDCRRDNRMSCSNTTCRAT